MDLSNVARRMDRFRRRIRSLYLIFGFSTILVALVSLLFLSFALDYLLDLPFAVRLASFAIALVAVLVVATRSVIYPLSIRLGDDDLALAAEARLPELKDRLISALEFKSRLADPENTESPEMMRAVIDEAAELQNTLEVARLTDAGRVGRRGLLAAGAVLAILLLAVAVPATMGTWARRNLLLMDIPWPRATTLVVLGFPESREKVLTRGESISVEVEAEGKVPDDVEIWYARMDEDDVDHRRMYQVEGKRGLFRFEFRQIPFSFRFWVEGGDDRDEEPVFTVLALIPPTIETIQASCVFPPYTGLEPETFREGDLDLPEGTEVTLDLRVNMPLESASMVRREMKPVSLALDEDRRTARTAFRVTRTFDYSIRLLGKDGQRNLEDSALFRIRAISDRRPLARILYPGMGQAYTLAGLVPFKLLATDNYGVARLSLFHQRGKEEPLRRAFTEKELSAPPGSDELVAYAAIPIASLAGMGRTPIRVGDRITYFAEAEDNNENTDRTDPLRIDVVSEEDLLRKLSQQQSSLREEAMDTRRDQEQALRETTGILEYLEQGEEFERRDRERIRDIQILQGRVSRSMDRFFASIGRVFNTFTYNRLANPKATERILVVLDDFLANDHADLSTVFKRDLYRRLIAGYRNDRIRDPDGVLGVLLEIMEISLRISEMTSPDAHLLLTGLSQGEPREGLAEDLKRTHDLQADILADFRLLDRKMQQWETWAELIQTARDIRDIVEQVGSGAEEILEKPKRDGDKR